MEQVTANINKLNGNVENQTAAVARAATALGQVVSNIQSVTQTLAENAANVKELQDASEMGKTSLQEVLSDIQDIARESEGLLEINSVMENIAGQTNLLSMNAAIEAARAGEAGKGFAVVAGEIRKLAESSSKQSNTIAIVLRKIKDSMDKMNRSTDDVLNKFEAIDMGIRTVAKQEESIRSSMEEQSHAGNQVQQAAGQVGEITQQVKNGSVEMFAGSQEVILESRNLERVTQEITNGMNEMAVGAEQVDKAVTAVNDLTGKTKENISTLVKSVSRFKV
jgi:methyl-accepting chemotaxis protein